MIISPKHGFVFLAQTKTGSSSVENAFKRFGQIVARGDPRFKHTPYRDFEAYFLPYLSARGATRSDLEVVSVVREPESWLNSWWRYRSRPQLSGSSDRYTGDMSFGDFVAGFLDGHVSLRKPSDFMRGADGSIGVDRLFAYENLEQLRVWLCDRVGEDVLMKPVNVSPNREGALSEELRGRLREELPDEFALYWQALGSPRPA